MRLTTPTSTKRPGSCSSPSSAATSDLRALAGCITALPTPFAGGALDLNTFADLVEWQIAEGIAGFAVGGPMGEASGLDQAEVTSLIETCVAVCGDRALVLAGIGFSSTARCVVAASCAKAAGAHGALVSTPAYNKPLQEGLYRHFETIARATSIPIVILNDPRPGNDLEIETVRRLAEIDMIAGIVDGSGDLDRPHVTSFASAGRLSQWAGDDASAVAFNSAGGQGCLSILANLAPRLCASIQTACQAGEWVRAETMLQGSRPLLDALRREPAAATVKFALSLLRPGFSASVRPPLAEVSRATAQAIMAALAPYRDTGTALAPARLAGRDRQAAAS